MRGGDGARRRLAISGAPALGEPRRRIVVEGIGACQNGVALARYCPQHGVGERRERRACRVGARRLDGEVDGRVVGRIEEQDLRRRDDERPFKHAATFGQAFVKPLRQRLADRAEPA